MIKHETTEMAVRDIDRYYKALDKVSINEDFLLRTGAISDLWRFSRYDLGS